jgi:hypothetical protein
VDIKAGIIESIGLISKQKCMQGNSNNLSIDFQTAVYLHHMFIVVEEGKDICQDDEGRKQAIHSFFLNHLFSVEQNPNDIDQNGNGAVVGRLCG